MTKQKSPTFEEVRDAIMAHLRERHWDETNTDRGIAISISLEANELLEYFQWGEKSIGTKEDMASELADILIYAIHLAHRYDIDLMQAVMQKLEKQAKKYPAEMFQTTDKAAQDKAWLELKKNHKKETTL